jgi:enoyl-CoA hydratase/carnithine racemase
MTALDTGTEDLRAEIDGGVAVITMNRPDRRNAFSQAMVSALGAVLAQAETDEEVGCVVLTGAGGAFCAGGDVKSMAAPPADRGDGAARSLDALIHRQRLNQRATSGRLWSMPIFPPADFEREVMERARRLAQGPSIAYRYMKENLNRAVSGELGDCMDLEVTHHVHTGLTQDHREAAQAFMDKREPRFRGR